MSDDEWRIRASPHGKLLAADPNCLRREYIAELLKRNGAALAALDALGGKEFSPPPINLDIIRFLHDHHALRDPVNQLAGMTMSGPSRKTAEHDRIVIWWILHDIYMLAKVVPERIKAEQRVRANAARKVGELALIGRPDELPELIERAHTIADKTEPIVGKKDPMRPPLSAAGVEAFQGWARPISSRSDAHLGAFLRGGVPTQRRGRGPRTSAEISGLGALAVIIPGW